MPYKKGYQCQIPGLENIYTKYFGDTDSGAFVEVGAFDCYTWSNTSGLAEAGWRGLYFEPQPGPVSECMQRYAGNPRIEIVCLALSDYPGERELFLGGSLSTIHEETKDMYLDIGWAQSTGLGEGKSIKVYVGTLDTELYRRRWPRGFEVLVIDVEGSELDVLNGFSLGYWHPSMAIIETHEHLDNPELAAKAEKIDAYFAEYTKIYSDSINSIYISEEM
jgi:FkbM family methyltransferase